MTKRELQFEFTQELINRLIVILEKEFGDGKKIPILELRKYNDKDVNELAEFIYENVLKPVFVVNVPEIDVEKTVDAMKQDKKNLGNGLALVMQTDGYKMVKITDLTEHEAKEVLSECQK